jgi:hypothetical protein
MIFLNYFRHLRKNCIYNMTLLYNCIILYILFNRYTKFIKTIKVKNMYDL